MATRRPARTNLLESIASPADLRKLPVSDLPQVAQEMREFWSSRSRRPAATWRRRSASSS
jgi:hypothetical protein